MSNIHFLSTGTKAEALARRISVSLFLFSSVLTGVLLLSQHFLLPQFTQIDVGGEIRDAEEVQLYHAQLMIDVSAAEKERNSIVLPIQDELYQQLQYTKHTQADYWNFRKKIQNAITQFSDDPEKKVSLEHIVFIESEDRIELKGHVSHKGLRSMTVLAQFTEVIRNLKFVVSVPNPQFIRHQTDSGNSYSPFTLYLQL